MLVATELEILHVEETCENTSVFSYVLDVFSQPEIRLGG